MSDYDIAREGLSDAREAVAGQTPVLVDRATAVDLVAAIAGPADADLIVEAAESMACIRATARTSFSAPGATTSPRSRRAVVSELTDARHITGEGQQDLADTAWHALEAAQEAAWQQAVATARAAGDEQWENWRYWHQDDFDGPEAYQVTNYWPAFSQREAHPGVAVQVMHKRTWRVHTVYTKRSDLETLPWHAQGAPRGAVIAARRAAQLGYPEW